MLTHTHTHTHTESYTQLIFQTIPCSSAPSARERPSLKPAAGGSARTSAARERRSLWLVSPPSRARPGPAHKDAQALHRPLRLGAHQALPLAPP